MESKYHLFLVGTLNAHEEWFIVGCLESDSEVKLVLVVIQSVVLEATVESKLYLW